MYIRAYPLRSLPRRILSLLVRQKKGELLQFLNCCLFFPDVIRDRPDRKSILMYVSNLYNKLAPGVSQLTVQRNGSRTVEKSEHKHTVSTKRIVSSTYHTEHTVKHVKKGYDEREPVRYVTTTSTTVKEPPIQHSAITTLVSLERVY